METGSDPDSPEITPEPALEIQVIPKILKRKLREKGYTRGYRWRHVMRTRREKLGRKRC